MADRDQELHRSEKSPSPDDSPRPPGSGDPLEEHESAAGRRDFLAKASKAAMAAGLVGGYGAFGAVGIRYLYPARPDELSWQYVRDVARIPVGGALRYRGPSGETINIARQGDTGTSEDFVALSSTCPHLGCQVRWEGQNNRFFCPCHNGVFDPSGVALEGPPAEAGQRLAAYPLKVENGLLQIAVPAVRLASGEEAQGAVIAMDDGPAGPGHDPCLAPPSRSDGKRRV
jgi:nitrite reductase/ring-hydroxylating ferredoxin subunit